MCGIFGYYHNNTPNTVGKIVSLTIDGLKRLEYRGYDSAGLCISNKEGANIIVKSIGNVSNLHSKIGSQNNIQNMLSDYTDTSSTIAHTRWATHGKPCDINAHPHTSDNEHTFVVVHNGIINNFNYIREFLNEKGYFMQSVTDTEVIPKLCKYIYDNNPNYTFTQIIDEVVRKLEGTFAILIKSTLYKNEYIACKKGSPLLIGVINNNINCCEYVFSSDMSAIIDHTNKVITLSDYEMACIKNNDLAIINYNSGIILTKNIEIVDINKSDGLKGDFTTYMEKEIFEQPITLKKTMYDRVHNNNVNIKEIKPFKTRILMANKIRLIACGTSYHSCLGSRMILEKLTNIPVCIECASDFVDREPVVKNGDICIFVSQSGETADTLYALQYAKKRGAFTIAITNKPDSSIARQANVSTTINVGFEISVASTKAYTSQLIMFVMLAFELSNNQTDIGLENISHNIEKTINMTKDQIAFIANEVSKYNSLLFIGRGNNYATALESALKTKEIAYIHSEGILAGELKHGPLALLDDRVLSFVFVTKDTMYDKMVNVVEQLKARGAKIIVICNENDNLIKSMIPASYVIEVPHVHEHIQHIVNIIPMQLLSYNLALIQGYNVDQPRNLAKSVTVSD
jgi:glucosamine--fructose-6-phosphate aminotransferase (isomerizing)